MVIPAQIFILSQSYLFPFTFIRNIIGIYFLRATNGWLAFGGFGATEIQPNAEGLGPILTNESAMTSFFHFDANMNANNATNQWKNPMHGHAGGEEIRPYTILSVSIYIY